MRGVLRFIIIATLLLGLAWWIGNLPGDVTAHSGKYTVETSVPAALLLLFIIALLFTALLRVASGVRRAPGGFFAWRGGRRARLGDIAMQRGMVALAAGDAAAAQAEAGRARKLLGDTPLVLLLVAESARLCGQTEQAQAAFLQLTGHKDMAFLGHRGLLRHTMAAGDHDTANTHAIAARAAYSGGSWLNTKRLEIAVKQQDWRAALGLTRKPAEIAAFATAAANASTDRKLAVGFGKQAIRADAALAPGIVAYAKALFAAGKTRAAKRALLAGWSTAPHPLIAQAWLEPAATPIERAQSAADLAAAKPGHPESELLLASTSLDAKLTGEARRHAEAAIAAGATDNRAALVLAALDSGGSALVPVAAGAVWVCSACHTTHIAWAPVCPTCSKPGALVWNQSKEIT